MSKKKRVKNTYLIIEHSGGRTFCYIEDPAHHRAAERSRQDEGLSRVDIGVLDNDCDIEQSMGSETYIVVPIGTHGG